MSNSIEVNRQSSLKTNLKIRQIKFQETFNFSQVDGGCMKTNQGLEENGINLIHQTISGFKSKQLGCYWEFDSHSGIVNLMFVVRYNFKDRSRVDYCGASMVEAVNLYNKITK